MGLGQASGQGIAEPPEPEDGDIDDSYARAHASSIVDPMPCDQRKFGMAGMRDPHTMPG